MVKLRPRAFLARTSALLVLASAPGARAQSASLLLALRVRAPHVTELAQAELDRCAKSGCPDLGALSLLLGTLLLSDGDAKAALAQLRAHTAPELLKPYQAFYEGEAEFYLQDFARAAQSFELAAQGGGAGLPLRAKAREAEALVAAKEVKKALPLFSEALRAVGSPTLLLERAKAADALKQRSQAAVDLRALLVHFPLSAEAADAAQLLSAEPSLRLPLGLEDRLGRARAFLDSGNADAAAQELSAVQKEKLARDAHARGQVALLWAGVLYSRGKDADAEKQLNLAHGVDAKAASDALLLKAKHLMRGPGAHPEAQKLMAEIAKVYPQEPAGEEAGFLAGWLLIQAGQFLAGSELLASYDARHSHARHREDASWFRAYGLLRAGHYAEAAGVLDGFPKAYPHSQLLPQARYWAARCRQLAGAKDVSGYRDIITQYAGTFYATLAQERLREAGQTPPPAFPVKPTLAQKLDSPELALARALARAGLLRDAAEEIQRRAGAVHGVDAAFALGQSLAELEEYGAAFSLAARLLWGAAYGQQHSPQALALLYPRAFAAELETDAKAQGVSPFLLWAIMRRESAFRPNLMSAANARGLMQLIPPTANSIARVLHEEPPAADALFSPSLNLRLSAWYVAQLMRRFHHPVLVAAAYNAGPAAAARWAQALQGLPVDVFVESIPFKETRAYVKQVVADVYNYQALYGGPKDSERLALTVPSTVSDGVDF